MLLYIINYLKTYFYKNDKTNNDNLNNDKTTNDNLNNDNLNNDNLKKKKFNFISKFYVNFKNFFFNLNFKIKSFFNKFFNKLKYIWSSLTLENFLLIVMGSFSLIAYIIALVTILPYKVIKYIVKCIMYYTCIGILKLLIFLKKCFKKSIKLETYKNILLLFINPIKKLFKMFINLYKIIFNSNNWLKLFIYFKNKLINIPKIFKIIKIYVLKSFGWKWLLFEKEIFDYREQYYSWAYLSIGTGLYYKIKLYIFKFIKFILKFEFIAFMLSPFIYLSLRIHLIFIKINKILKRFFFWYDGKKFYKVQVTILLVFYAYCWLGLAYGWNDDRYFFLKAYDFMFINYFIYKIGVYFYKLPKMTWYQWVWVVIQNIILLVVFYKIVFSSLKWLAYILDTPVEWETMPWVLKLEKWLDSKGWFKHHPDSHFRKTEMNNYFKAQNIRRFRNIYDKDASIYMRNKYEGIERNEKLPDFIKKLKNAFNFAMDEERKARANSKTQPVSEIIILEREYRDKLEKAYFAKKALLEDQLIDDEISNNEFVIQNKLLNREIDEKMFNIRSYLFNNTSDDERAYASGYGLYNGVHKIKTPKPINILNPDVDLFADKVENKHEQIEKFIMENFSVSSKNKQQNKFQNKSPRNALKKNNKKDSSQKFVKSDKLTVNDFYPKNTSVENKNNKIDKLKNWYNNDKKNNNSTDRINRINDTINKDLDKYSDLQFKFDKEKDKYSDFRPDFKKEKIKNEQTDNSKKWYEGGRINTNIPDWIKEEEIKDEIDKFSKSNKETKKNEKFEDSRVVSFGLSTDRIKDEKKKWEKVDAFYQKNIQNKNKQKYEERKHASMSTKKQAELSKYWEFDTNKIYHQGLSNNVNKKQFTPKPSSNLSQKQKKNN